MPSRSEDRGYGGFATQGHARSCCSCVRWKGAAKRKGGERASIAACLLRDGNRCGAQPLWYAYTDRHQLASINLKKVSVLETIHHLFV